MTETVEKTTVGVKAGDWRTWLLIGATGFGGPAGQMAILHREVVERKKWLDEDEFLAAMRVCMLLPGPEAQQLATYAGWRLGGIGGGIVAGTLFVVPGALIVTALAWLRVAGSGLPAVAAAFAGTRPVVVALVALAAWRIATKSIQSSGAAMMAAGALVALGMGVPFPIVVAVAAAVGFMTPASLLGMRDASKDTDAPVPGLARHGRMALTVAAGTVAIWLACYAVVAALRLAGGEGARIAMLFTETTLLSLGGAYAVVPWALDESLARGWLDPTERFDALAMGEATPGPLILVVTFIGFLAGWKTHVGGDAVAGIEGAAIATAFAFIPSFGMVLTLAPFVRSIRVGSRVGRAMTAIGAAVVAAIVLLGMRLAIGAFVVNGRLDMVAVALSLAAGFLLHTKRLSTPLVILLAAAVGAATAAVR